MRNFKMNIGCIIFLVVAALTVMSTASAGETGKLDSNGGTIIKEFKSPVAGIVYARLTKRADKIILTGWNNEDLVVYYPDSDQSFNYRTGQLEFGDQTIEVLADLKEEVTRKGL